MEIPKSFKIDFSRSEDGTLEDTTPDPQAATPDLSDGPPDYSTPPQEAGDPPGASPTTSSPTPDAEPAPEGAPSDLILGKFKSQEDLQQAYLELQQRLGGSPEEPAEEPSEDLRPPETDFQAFVQEFQEKGELSEDSYKTLQEIHGLPKEFVDSYIEGQKAKAEQQLTYVMREAGVRDSNEYQQIAQWASENLPQGEVEVFNRTVQGDDLTATQAALKGLVAQYRAKTTKAVRLKAKPQSAPAVQPFSEMREMQHAMRDPRYQYDAAYRKSVEDRLKVTPDEIFGGRINIKGPNR